MFNYISENYFQGSDYIGNINRSTPIIGHENHPTNWFWILLGLEGGIVALIIALIPPIFGIDVFMNYYMEKSAMEAMPETVKFYQQEFLCGTGNEGLFNELITY